MADNLYHAYQLESTMPIAYLTKSNGAEPIIKALRERRDSDLSLTRSVSSDRSSKTAGSEASESAPLTVIARLMLHYSQMVTTMADVH